MMKQLLLLITFIGISLATVISVPNDYGTIQDAIDASMDGDMIVLEQGNYSENIVIDNKNIIIGSKYLTTGDDFYIITTRIAGDSDIGPSVTFKNNITNTAGLIGLTVNQNLIFGGCWGGLPLMPGLGGAINCMSGANPRLENLEIYVKT